MIFMLTGALCFSAKQQVRAITYNKPGIYVQKRIKAKHLFIGNTLKHVLIEKDTPSIMLNKG